MEANTMILKGIVQNIGFLLALFYLHGLISAYCKSAPKYFQGMISGLIFAAIASLYMMTKVNLLPGIILDGRGILPGIACAYGGIVPGVTAALLICLSRSFIGGPDLLLGSLMTFGSALIGILFWIRRNKSAVTYSPWMLLILGIALALQAQLWASVFSPATISLNFFGNQPVYIFVLYPIGTLLLGLLLNRSEYQVQLKLQLSQSKEQYQTLFREMIDAFALHEIICDDRKKPVDYRFLAVNPAFERLTGLDGATLVGKRVLEVLPNTESYWIENFGAVALTGKPVSFENYSRELGRYYQVTAFRPALKQFACIFVDITDRRNTEKVLWASKERFQKVFHSQLAAIFVLNTEDPARILECNHAAADILGFRADEMIGAPIEKFFVDKSHRENFLIDLSDAVKNDGCLRNAEFALKRKNGKSFPAEHTVMELKDDNGERSGWVHVVRDLTDRKEMEAQLRQAQRMEAIGTLAGGIAHDFNNILSPIIGMAELLLDDLPENSMNHEDVRMIFDAGKRGSQLVKQILAFSRQSEHQLVPVRMQHVLKEVLQLVRSTIPKDIKIFSDIDSQCGLVMADAIQIHQIAMNLITNAFHAVNPNGGEIYIKLKQVRLNGGDPGASALAPGQYASLSVTDTGHGIAAEVMGKIFDPYFTTKEQGKGTGLGLSVVYGIVKNYGGDITAESEVGRGAAFTVWLPVMERFVEHEYGVAENAAPRGIERVLLVDDEAQIVKFERKMLERLGYRVTERTSSIEALEAFKAAPDTYDIVVTDMAMPNMTGDRLAQEMLLLRPKLPIIICTGFSEKITPEKAQAIGIKGFLMKPIVRSDLAQLIKNVLHEKTSAPNLGHLNLN